MHLGLLEVEAQGLVAKAVWSRGSLLLCGPMLVVPAAPVSRN